MLSASRYPLHATARLPRADVCSQASCLVDQTAGIGAHGRLAAPTEMW